MCIYIYHLFGDSHICHIGNDQVKQQCLIAGSAMGLDNINSVSGYQQIFLYLYNTIPLQDNIFMKFGQVDTEFVYYIKLANNNTLLFEDFAKDSVEKYFNFITQKLDTSRITILSIYPPFTNDTFIKKSVTNLHFMDDTFKEKLINDLNKLDIPTINEQVKYNKVYNDMLAEKCKQYNIKFIDLFSVLVNENSDSLYVNNVNDHHLLNHEGIHKINDIVNNYINSS